MEVDCTLAHMASCLQVGTDNLAIQSCKASDAGTSGPLANVGMAPAGLAHLAKSAHPASAIAATSGGAKRRRVSIAPSQEKGTHKASTANAAMLDIHPKAVALSALLSVPSTTGMTAQDDEELGGTGALGLFLH
jgi:hypothetical protein